MPNSKSAKKRVRKTITRTAENETYSLAITKGMKKIKKMKPADAKKSVAEMHSNIDKAAKRGVIHKNKAARLKSQVSTLAAAN
jgi:small subunit ribosomal protein S20